MILHHARERDAHCVTRAINSSSGFADWIDRTLVTPDALEPGKAARMRAKVVNRALIRARIAKSRLGAYPVDSHQREGMR